MAFPRMRQSCRGKGGASNLSFSEISPQLKIRTFGFDRVTDSFFGPWGGTAPAFGHFLKLGVVPDMSWRVFQKHSRIENYVEAKFLLQG